MDIVENCQSMIQEKLAQLDATDDIEEFSATQAAVDGCSEDNESNIDKIMNQQTHLKRIIDQDNQIHVLKKAIAQVTLDIENLRKHCTKYNQEVIKGRHEQLELQAKELERFQMGQLKSIAADYERHQEILELRKKEVINLKKEIEREENERDAYLADVEKKLEKQVQDRQKATRGNELPFELLGGLTGHGSTDEADTRERIELTSVDEYAPYGAAPHSRLPARASSSSGPRGGRGRGGRRRRG